MVFSQIDNYNANYESFGRTGEYTIAYKSIFASRETAFSDKIGQKSV